MSDDPPDLLARGMTVSRGGAAGFAQGRVSGVTQRGPTGTAPPLQSVANCSAADILGTMPVRQVWEWYGRLAQAISTRQVAGGGEPLASRFLRRYLSPRSGPGRGSAAQPIFVFDAPDYLKADSRLRDELLYHRKVYLTQEQARLGGGSRWAGIRPRWENPGSYNWNQSDPLSMHYEALVSQSLTLQVFGSQEEKDLFNALGLGYQLRTEVVVSVSQASGGNELDVTFQQFQAKVVDRYDFNYTERLTVPNPDHGSTSPGAVCPGCDRITVYHSNARRMEDAHLAAPYDLESVAWDVSDPTIAGPGRVTL